MVNKLLWFVPLLLNTVFLLLVNAHIGASFLSVHDSPLLLTVNDAYKSFYFWNDNSFGYTNFLEFSLGTVPRVFSALLLEWGASAKMMELLYYFVVLNSISYSFFFASHKLISYFMKIPSLVPILLGTIFYSYNLYMIAAWHGGITDGVFLTISISPLLFLLSVEVALFGLNLRRALQLALYISLTLNTVPYALALYISTFVPAILIYLSKFSVRALINISITALAIFAMSIFYLLPLFYAYTKADPFPLRNGAEAFAFSSLGISGLFRFFFEWTMNQFWGGRYFHSYYPYFANSLVAFSAFVIWVIAFSPIIKIKDTKEKKFLLFLILSIVLSFFISKASQAPFGFLNLLFYKFIPLFTLFRTPDTKFGLPIVTALSILVVFSLYIYRQKTITIVLVLCIALQTLVFFSTIPVIEIRVGDSYQRIVKIPNEYQEISQILNNDPEEGRVFSVPGLSYANYDYKNTYGLTGQDILGKLINRPMVYSDRLILGKSEEKYSSLSSSLNPTTMGDASIRYILIRDDTNNIDTTKQKFILNHSSSAKLIYQSKIASIYKISGNYVKDVISIQNSIRTVPIITKKINPTKYTVTVSSKEIDNSSLFIFRSSFHGFWRLTSSSKKVAISNHELYDSYANAWMLNNKSGVDDVLVFNLDFVPHTIFNPFLILSLFSILTVVLCIIFFTFMNKSDCKKTFVQSEK